MRTREIMPSQIMDRLVEEWDIDIIDSQDVKAAMDALQKATVGLADAIDPTCLVASSMELRDSGPIPHKPVDCGLPASADNHSIQENGVLSRLVSPSNRSKTVLQLFPTASSLASQLKEPGKHPGSEFVWNHARVIPKPLSTSLASVRHFACGPHDGDTLALADNLDFPPTAGYYQIADGQVPGELRGFARGLHRLAYRTLLFRISQLRGTELVVTQQLDKQIRGTELVTGPQSDRQVGGANRFAVDSLLKNLTECSAVSAKLYRQKLLFDQDLVESKRLRLVHHITPFIPTIRYAASEYLIETLVGLKGKPEVSFSFNLIPDDVVTWAVLSHADTYDRQVTSHLKNKLLDVACTTEHLRRKNDLEFLSSFTNMYVSQEDYNALPESDRSQIEEKLAYKVCEEPHLKTIEFLKSFPAGKYLIERITRKIKDEMRKGN
ncbi:MAG: hypothetical protein F4X65_13960 [Chloroflexi bacterium]|nr:hypothetical protein [Chloroflexota bacterium]